MPDDHQPFLVETSASAKWLEISEFPALAAAEIQVWRIPLIAPPAETAQAAKALTGQERERAASFRFLADQRRFVLRRFRLRQLLASQLAIPPSDIRLEHGSHGKPFIAKPAGQEEIKFNCSHSGDLALVAVARGIELGVDLQQHQPMSEGDDLARKYFSAAEIHELAQLPPALKTTGFFNCWTRKEAFIKAIGLGLACPLNRFSVSLTPGQPAAILNVEDEPEAVKAWSLVSLEAAAAYSAALVFGSKAARLQYFTWGLAHQA